MNQGGGGNWGAIDYRPYDIIALAESNVVKNRFKLNWNSGTPVMSVQEADDNKRHLTEVQDLDPLGQQVRPIVTFTNPDTNLRVVFMHLKSASVPYATDALNATVDALGKKLHGTAQQNQKILWIGDFNRADDSYLKKTCNANLLYAGGGQALWNLDRAYASGDWTGFSCSSSVVSVSGDNAHIAIAVTVERTG
jgi:hypothetical protein